jgi:hypothetical protein
MLDRNVEELWRISIGTIDVDCGVVGVEGATHSETEVAQALLQHEERSTGNNRSRIGRSA